MKKRKGRPKGTTRKNGFKVAVDSDSYWEKRGLSSFNKKQRMALASAELINEKERKEVRSLIYKRFAEVMLSKKPVNGFMDRVAKGLEKFLSPYNK